MDATDYYNEEGGYEIEIWVETSKSLEEFEATLANVIHPLSIEDHQFSLGGIKCDVHCLGCPEEVPVFEGVPQVEYSFGISVRKVDYDLWGSIDHHFAFAMAWGLRGKFSCRYLITANIEFFICQAGANLPTYINTCYKPWVSGELVNYRQTSNKPTIELHIPSQNPYN